MTKDRSASCVLVRASRHQSLPKDCFGETPKPAGETRATQKEVRHHLWSVICPAFGLRHSFELCHSDFVLLPEFLIENDSISVATVLSCTNFCPCDARSILAASIR